MANILIVDDEMGIRELLSEILEDENHTVVLASNAAQARASYAQTDFELVLLDIWMPDADGMTVLRDWVAQGPLRCPVVMMSGHASIDTALEAQSLGARAFLEKPITMAKLLGTVKQALAAPTLAAPNQLASHAHHPVLEAPANHFGQGSDGAASDSARGLLVEPKIEVLDAHASLMHTWQQNLAQIDFNQPLREFREHAEWAYFQYLMVKENGSMTRLSELAGLERTHLYRKLKQLDIDVKRRPKH
jgi:DNA-binding NtrC family response regulator